jgi:hypothetical protein
MFFGKEMSKMSRTRSNRDVPGRTARTGLAMLLGGMAMAAVLALSASAEVSGLKIGRPEFIYTASGKRVGARPDIDCSFATWRKDANTMYFYNSWDGGGLFCGPLDDPYRQKVGDVPVDKNGHDGDLWIPNVYKHPDGTMIGFVHREVFPVPADGCFRIGIAVSRNAGSSWVYCGDTIKPRVNWTDPKSPDLSNIGGVPYVVRVDPADGKRYFYVYFNESTGAERRMSVARAVVDDVVAAAGENRTTPFFKYNDGRWTEPGLTGVASNILPGGVFTAAMMKAGICRRDMHADAAYCAPLGKYLLTTNDQSESKLLLFSSPDGIHWGEETELDADPTREKFMPYSSFVSLDPGSSEDCSVVGAEFDILYPRKVMKTWLDDFTRIHCVVTKAADKPKADDPYWTPEKIALFSKKYGIHDKGYHFHFPRESFLKYGYFPPGGYVKDFSVLRHDGRWHVFYIDGRREQICWISGNEIAFGHASTDDFRHWIRHSMPLAIGDGPFDNKHVWAPFVLPHGDLFYMFYMGEGTEGTYIAYAVSKDLETWTKKGTVKIAKGRDPYIFKHGDRYIMSFTAHYEVDGKNALGACWSRDLEHWEPLPEIMLTTHGGPESSSIHPLKDGKYVAWVNDWGEATPEHPETYRACYAFSDDPLRFDGSKLTTFRFFKGDDEVPLDEEWNEPNGMFTQAPGAIELVAQGEKGIWLIAYYRIIGNGFRLFFGELDWTTTPATIREINTEEHLERVLERVGLR